MNKNTAGNSIRNKPDPTNTNVGPPIYNATYKGDMSDKPFFGSMQEIVPNQRSVNGPVNAYSSSIPNGGMINVESNLRRLTYIKPDESCTRGAESPWKPKGRQ
jgi:hypothetical protein